MCITSTNEKKTLKLLIQTTTSICCNIPFCLRCSDAKVVQLNYSWIQLKCLSCDITCHSLRKLFFSNDSWFYKYYDVFIIIIKNSFLWERTIKCILFDCIEACMGYDPLFHSSYSIRDRYLSIALSQHFNKIFSLKLTENKANCNNDNSCVWHVQTKCTYSEAHKKNSKLNCRWSSSLCTYFSNDFGSIQYFCIISMKITYVNVPKVTNKKEIVFWCWCWCCILVGYFNRTNMYL